MAYLQLVYASAASVNFSDEELRDLLAISRENNAKEGVTGVLLFMEGSFLQVLEGGKGAVEELYERISLDQRHGKVVLLLRRFVDERAFGDWAMGYVNAGRKRRELEGFFDLVQSGSRFSDLEGDNERVKQLLSGFKQGKWRRTID